ncbi:Phosphoribosylamine--glycine ligase [Qipengyuania citrea LAMA 915]|uniref:Phosphoribosylamine--glycine ligase n=1 Tax=Qipengyuania citrea LAMA 915 TaxID=1306953 RepID=A0A0L1KBZ9_9SPHN|nr:Phosphoribosylamine--glycine ligase [Qipengyuania citrea LAMA 915]
MQLYPWMQRLSAQEPACQSAAFLFFVGTIARVFPPRQNSEAQGRIGSIIKQRAAGSFVSTRKPLRRDHEKGPRKGALRSSRYCRSTVEQPFPEIPHDHNS